MDFNHVIDPVTGKQEIAQSHESRSGHYKSIGCLYSSTCTIP